MHAGQKNKKGFGFSKALVDANRKIARANYLAVESALTVVSAAAAASAAILANESATAIESAVAFALASAAALSAPPQATKAAAKPHTINIANTFFIVCSGLKIFFRPQR
jgi:hypothetical protein